jgi:AbrB family looped-hinge helix DNA binding protein
MDIKDYGSYNGSKPPIKNAMNQPITMDRAGRIVVPSEVRRQLGLVAGSTLMLDVVAQRIELTPQPRADAELLVRPGKRTVLRPTGAAFDAAAATRAERDTQATRKK